MDFEFDSITLLADSARGAYIPQYFAKAVKRELVTGVSPEDWNTLEVGPAHDYYWDTWERVMNNARVAGRYILHHDGDLWLIDYDAMTEDDRVLFGFSA